MRKALFHFQLETPAVHQGHLHIEEDKIVLSFFDFSGGLGAVEGLVNLVSKLGEKMGQKIQKELLIIYDQNSLRHFSFLNLFVYLGQSLLDRITDQLGKISKRQFVHDIGSMGLNRFDTDD